MKVIIDLDDKTLKSVQDLAVQENRVRKHMLEYIIKMYVEKSVQVSK